MRPIFLLATDLSPRDPSFARASAQGERVADACAPILGFRPEIEVAHLPVEGGDEAPRSLATALHDHAARGRTLSFVLPAILDLSVFQRQALVEITRETQRRHPALSVHYDDIDPCHRLVLQAFVEALWELLAGSDVPPGRLGVLLVAAGSGDAEGRARTYQRMRLLWEQLAAARGEVAFIRHPRPSVPEALERCGASPLHWIAAPELFWPGEPLAYAELLFEDFRRAHEGTGPRLARPVGESPHIAAWIAERLLSLFRAHSARRDARAPSLVHAPSARESAVIGPLASCTLDILPKPLGPDLAYGPGVIAEIADGEGLARLLAHFEVTAPWVFVKVTWHGYATGTYTDAATLDKLLSALPGKAVLLEGHSTGRNTGGGADWDWETEAREHRAFLLDQEAEFLRRTGIAEVMARHGAEYVNVTEAYWDGACAPREEVLGLLAEAGVTLRSAELAAFVPAVVLAHRGAPFISFARFKGPTRLGISNCFGLLPPPLRSGFHGPSIDHFARVSCDLARLYGALLRPYGLVEALHSAVRWSRDGLYRSRFGNYDLVHAPGLVTLSRGLPAADVLASRLQGQDVRRSAFFAAVFDELGAPEEAISEPIPEELVHRFV